MMTPAKVMFTWSRLVLRSCFSPIWTVRYWSSSVTSSGHRYWFHAREEREDRQGGDRRPGQRHRDPGHEPQCP